MSLYEERIKDLGKLMGIPLISESKETCCIQFDEDKVTVQVDLDDSGERLLIGSVLGEISSGSYRNEIFKQALRVNGLSKAPRGILAYSDRLSSLILFDYLPFHSTDAQKLFNFIQLFHKHAEVWIDSLKSQTIPQIEREEQKGSGMFGMIA